MRSRLISTIIAMALVSMLVASTAPGGTTIERAREKVLDESTSSAQFTELSNTLETLNASQQTELMREVFLRAEPPLASECISGLISRGMVDDDTLTFLVAQIGDWNPTLQGFVVQSISFAPNDKPLRYAPTLRAILESARQRYHAVPDIGCLRTIDNALVTLRWFGDARVVNEASAVVRQIPRSSGAWIVLLDAQAVGVEEQAIAQAVFDDAECPRPIRFLAAIALSETSALARQFVQDVLGDVLDEYGPKSLEDMLMANRAAVGADAARREFSRFYHEVLPILSYVSLVRAHGFDDLLRLGIASRNEYVRDMTQYAVARLSPEMLLGDQPLDEPAMLRLAAHAWKYHPAMRTKLTTRFGAAELENEVTKIPQRGPVQVGLGVAMRPLPFAS